MSTLPIDSDFLTILQQIGGLSEDQRKAANRERWLATGLGLLGTRKGNEAAAMGRAGLLGMGAHQRSLEGSRNENMDRMRMQEYASQVMARQAKAKADQEAAAYERETGTGAQDILRSIGARSQLPSMSPTVANAQALQAATPNRADAYEQLVQYYLSRGDEKKAELARKQAQDYRAKYNPTAVTGIGPDGQPVFFQTSDYEAPRQIQGLAPPPDLQLVDTGGRKQFVDKLRTAPGTSFDVTMDPFQRDQSARGWAAHGLNVNADRRAAESAQRERAGTYDPERGIIVDTRGGTARPVMVDGQPLGAKPSASAKKAVEDIDAQMGAVRGAIRAAEATPSAFGFWRGTATKMGATAESLAGRTDSEAEALARSYVFNNVSKVINERAGAAQSVQELARLRSFLPAEQDGPREVVVKMRAFEKYLSDQRATYGHAQGGGNADPLGIR